MIDMDTLGATTTNKKKLAADKTKSSVYICRRKDTVVNKMYK